MTAKRYRMELIDEETNQIMTVQHQAREDGNRYVRDIVGLFAIVGVLALVAIAMGWLVWR